MNVFIRVDASVEIGMGHVMRCLTLAQRISKEGKNVSFICRSAQGNCIQLIENAGFKVYLLPHVEVSLWTYTTEHWRIDAEQTMHILQQFEVQQVVVDHYSLDENWEKKIRLLTKEIIVIDDLANRKHDCDFLIDQNFYSNMESRYEGLVPLHTKLLVGPKYVLLREEFVQARQSIKSFNGKIERIFVFFGGSDPTNETEKVLRAIKPLLVKHQIMIDIVVGSSNQNKNGIKKLCDNIQGVEYHCQINNIAELMAKADFAIGAGGATTWERAYLQLPTVVIAVAKNQVEVAEEVSTIGAICFLGYHNEVLEDLIQITIMDFLNNPQKIYRMQLNCDVLMCL